MISLKVVVSAILMLFLGCKSIKNESPKESNLAMSQKETRNNTEKLPKDNCPENGACTWGVQTNTNLVLKKDTIGALYPVFEKEEGIDTIKFEYDRKTEKGLADGSYREVVYFHIPATTKSLTLKNEALKEVDLTYARLCFCRGATGYVPVTKGALTVTKTDSGYRVQLSFENGTYPQIINNLDGVASVITE